MLLHCLSWTAAAASILFLLPELRAFSSLLPGSRVNWDRSLTVLRDLREKLESGWLPDSSQWNMLETLERPWGMLAAESLADLRQGGVPLVPTLKRFEKVLSDQKQADLQSRARSAQAWGQAAVCGGIVPLISLALYLLVPGLSDWGWKWLACTLAALLFDAAAMAWMLRLAESARWAGLAADRRSWWIAVQCFGERLLGLLRGGLPPDLAWAKAMPQLQRQAPSLISCWGADLWSEPVVSSVGRLEPSARAIVAQGLALRKAIQASIYEGKGCSDRLEASLQALRMEWDSEVERQMQLLSTRALKPLFLLVAPSILLLLVLAFWLSWESWGVL